MPDLLLSPFIYVLIIIKLLFGIDLQSRSTFVVYKSKLFIFKSLLPL